MSVHLGRWEFYRDWRDQWIGRFRDVDRDGTDHGTYYAFLTLVARRRTGETMTDRNHAQSPELAAFAVGTPSRGKTKTPPGLTPKTVHNLMGLAARDIPPLGTVQTWTPEQLASAAAWASREHLSASDNPVRRLARPEHTYANPGKSPQC
jgi:hypothetical protein